MGAIAGAVEWVVRSGTGAEGGGQRLAGRGPLSDPLARYGGEELVLLLPACAGGRNRHVLAS